MSKIDKAKADLLSTTEKVINEDICWELTDQGHELNVKVIAPDLNEVLELRGKIGKANRSFTLLYRKEPIRRYCAQGRHTAPDGTRIDGHHKHTWDEVSRDGYIYVPDDIDENADVNDQLFQFMQEQNILCVGDYQRIFI